MFEYWCETETENDKKIKKSGWESEVDGERKRGREK